jgi:hypothetical protein
LQHLKEESGHYGSPVTALEGDRKVNKPRSKLSGWVYAFAALIPMLGCLTAMALVYQWFPGLPGTFESEMNLDNLTQVVVPGSEDITFAESGAYAVYYEYRSVVDGVVYNNSETPPALACSLTSKATGADVGIAPDYVKTNTYSTKDRERVGVLIRSITIDEPGIYTFSCRYEDGREQPELVLAIGPNFVWEFFGIAARTIVTAAAGLAVLLGSSTVAIVAIIIVAVKRHRSSTLTLVACLVFAALFLSGSALAWSEGGQEEAAPGSCCDPHPRGCTIFTVSQGDRVFFGGNGDWINFDSNYYWVDPGSDTRYGAIYFGVPENVQQGFNEKGLAYDSNGLPPAPVTSHPGRKPVYGDHSSYFIHILQECATVEEVIAWVQEHQWHEAMHYQMHFADATGDAVVISAGADGKIAFTRKPPDDGFLVSTNFNLANRVNGSYPCWRYDRAEALLSEIDSQDELTAERAASVLDAVHVESTTVWTIMSVVGDLPQGLVYVYLFHQFDVPIVLNVAEEIARAPDSGPLRDLFPPETVSQADQAYQRLMARSTRCNTASFIWLGLVVASFAILLLVARPGRRGLAFWAPVVAVLGPLGLLARLITARGHQRRVLVEAAGDLPPCVLGMMVALLTIVLMQDVSQNSLLQLLAFYGLPLVFALFLYQAPLFAWKMRYNYVRAVVRRLPAVLISTNLALAGLLAVDLPLIKWHLECCGFNGLTALSWWAIAVLGASAGGLLLCIYHAWATRRGFAAWSALLWSTGEADGGIPAVSSPPWRCLWLWVLLSFVVLVAGIVLGAMGSTLAAGVG